MLLRTLLLAGITLSGCGKKAPAVTWCVIHGDAALIYCQHPDGTQTTLTIQEADKYIAQPLADAQKLRNYVIDLEKQLAHCK